jgi:PhzF family phenazine biosynthesis protein
MSNRLAHPLVDVFTRERFAGNPLAVFPDGQDLDAARMQCVACELDLSETTFVLPATRGDCDVRVRIFTPRRELPMAGHPVVGTAFVREREGRAADRVTFGLGVGPTPVERILGPDGRPIWRMQQQPARFAEPVGDRAALARALGLAPGDLGALPIEPVSTGNCFAMVELANLDALARARLTVAQGVEMGRPERSSSRPRERAMTSPPCGSAAPRSRWVAGGWGAESPTPARGPSPSRGRHRSTWRRARGGRRCARARGGRW